MAFYFSQALKLFFRTFSFVFARIIANAYFVLFSAIIALFFILVPYYFEFFSSFDLVFLVLGLIIFLVYWNFFRNRILYVLRVSGAVVISEYVFGRNVPVSRQASFGFNLIKEKFSFLRSFRLFEEKSKKVISKTYGVLGFISFIPNVTQAISSAVLSYVFADKSVEPFTSLRDGLVLFYQKKNLVLFQVFAMQIFSYIVFLLFYLVLFVALNPFLSSLVYPFNLVSFVLLFLLLLLFYSSFVSHFLVCWQSIYFIETIRSDFPSKNTRALLEDISQDFNEISSSAKVFVPLNSITSRNLMYSFDREEREKTASLLASLDGIIKNKNETKGAGGKEALSDLVFKITKIKKTAKKKEVKKKRAEEKKRLEKKYFKEKEYNKVFNLLLEFLADQLGTKNKYKVEFLERKGSGWYSRVLINNELFEFELDENGTVIDFKEKKE